MKNATKCANYVKSYIDDYLEEVLEDFSSNAKTTITMTLNKDDLGINIRIEDGEREFTRVFAVDSNTDLDAKFSQLKLLNSLS